MKKKFLICIILSMIIGIFLGNSIYNGYEEENKAVFNEKQEKNIYLIQYGVYSSNDSMIQNTKNLTNYFYYEENGKFHVLIGITGNKDLKDKIVNSYNINSDIYLKEKKVDNATFIESLNQYDGLIKETDNESTILNAEKQILSKYEELILKSE